MFRSVSRLVVDVALWMDQSEAIKAMIQHPAAHGTEVACMRCSDETTVNRYGSMGRGMSLR